MFITFEGVEGSGKTLQARLLSERLRAAGVPVLTTREPGGTRLGDKVRSLVLDQSDYHVGRRAEALLMGAARAQHVEEVITPALERGETVVCDRFSDSTRAYQGAGRGLAIQTLEPVISFATAGLSPHMTLLLDIPIEVGLARKQTQQDWNRFDAEARAFHERVREAFQSLARAEPERWTSFDACKPVEVLAHEIWGHVAARMGLS